MKQNTELFELNFNVFQINNFKKPSTLRGSFLIFRSYYSCTLSVYVLIGLDSIVLSKLIEHDLDIVPQIDLSSHSTNADASYTSSLDAVKYRFIVSTSLASIFLDSFDR